MGLIYTKSNMYHKLLITAWRLLQIKFLTKENLIYKNNNIPKTNITLKSRTNKENIAPANRIKNIWIIN